MKSRSILCMNRQCISNCIFYKNLTYLLIVSIRDKSVHFETRNKAIDLMNEIELSEDKVSFYDIWSIKM